MYDHLIFDGLPQLSGTKEQIECANEVREWALLSIWEQEFHRNSKEFYEDCNRLPVEADWWIQNQTAAYEAVCSFLGYQMH